MPPTDNEMIWIEAARAGDHQAFKQIIDSHAPKIAATIKGMLGDTQEAQDVGQEVFIHFYRALKQFKGDSSVGTYLTRIAINLSLNEIKRKKSWLAHLPHLHSQEIDSQAAAPNTPEQSERQRQIRQAIDSLALKYRAVIVLRLIQGYSTQETAAILKIPLGTVQSRLARGQLKLRELLLPQHRREK